MDDNDRAECGPDHTIGRFTRDEGKRGFDEGRVGCRASEGRGSGARRKAASRVIRDGLRNKPNAFIDRHSQTLTKTPSSAGTAVARDRTQQAP